MGVPEEYEERREDHACPDVEQDQAADGIEQADEFPGKGQSIHSYENKEDYQDQPEVDQGLHIPGQQEQVLGYVHLGKDPRVVHDSTHAAVGGVLEKREYQVPTEDIDHVMRRVPPEELGKYQRHDQQLEQRR